MAHPVRPESYVEINNFYTLTVYNKGAEVIRMMRTILDPAGFRKGTDLYFSRHDGQAVTTDDFVKAMEDATRATSTSSGTHRLNAEIRSAAL
jgi:aminopeptidase N